ncbi:hypothetical protein COOONC_16333 [Cooperia oncophora]
MHPEEGIISSYSHLWCMGKTDLTNLVVYCAANNNETAERMRIAHFILCGIDIFSLVGMTLLYVFNVAAMKRNFSDLQSSYQLRENDSVFRLLLPLVVFNGTCHLTSSISTGVLITFREHFSYVTYRTFLGSTYTVPYFTLVSPFLLWFIIRKSKRIRVEKLKMLGRHPGNERDLYFRVYSRMWNK